MVKDAMVIPLDYLFPYSHGKTVSGTILLKSSKYNRSPKCNIDLVLDINNVKRMFEYFQYLWYALNCDF